MSKPSWESKARFVNPPSKTSWQDKATFQDGPQEQEDSSPSIGSMILDKVGEGLEYIDNHAGGPARAALKAIGDKENPITAFTSQFGEENPPTGAETAEAFEPSIPQAAKDALKETESFGPEERLISRQLNNPIGKTFGPGVELLVDPLNLPVTKGIDVAKDAALSLGINKKLYRRATKNAFDALVKGATKAELKLSKGREELIGKALVKEDLINLIKDPQSMRVKIGTEGIPFEDLPHEGILDTDYSKIKGPARQPGLLSHIAEDLDKVISESSKQIKDKVDVTEIINNSLAKDTARRLDPSVADDLGNVSIAKKKKILDQYLKPLSTYDEQGNLISSRYRSLEQIHKMKKSVGQLLNSRVFRNPNDADIAYSKEVIKDLYHDLKRTLETHADRHTLANGMTLGEYIKSQNKRMEGLYEISRLTESPAFKQVKGENLMDKLINVLGGAVSGAAVGAVAPGMDATTGAALGAGIKLSSEKLAPHLKAPAATFQSGAAKLIEGGDIPSSINSIPAGFGAAGSLNSKPQEKKPVKMPLSYNLPQELMKTRLPRNSEEIYANKNFVLAKVAQQFPNAFPMLKDALDNDPMKIKDLMPALTKALPDLFERDAYDRVDGVVYDPIKQELFRKDVLNRDDLSNTEKYSTLSAFNKDNKIPKGFA